MCGGKPKIFLRPGTHKPQNHSCLLPLERALTFYAPLKQARSMPPNSNDGTFSKHQLETNLP